MSHIIVCLELAALPTFETTRQLLKRHTAAGYRARTLYGGITPTGCCAGVVYCIEEEAGWQSARPYRGVRIIGVGDIVQPSWASDLFTFDVRARPLSEAHGSSGSLLTRMLRRTSTGGVGRGDGPPLPTGASGSRYRLGAASHAEAVEWVAALNACLPAEQRRLHHSATEAGAAETVVGWWL